MVRGFVSHHFNLRSTFHSSLWENITFLLDRFIYAKNNNNNNNTFDYFVFVCLFGGCYYNCDSSVWCTCCMTVCFPFCSLGVEVTAGVSQTAARLLFVFFPFMFWFCHQCHGTKTRVACAVCDYWKVCLQSFRVIQQWGERRSVFSLQLTDEAAGSLYPERK